MPDTRSGTLHDDRSSLGRPGAGTVENPVARILLGHVRRRSACQEPSEAVMRLGAVGRPGLREARRGHGAAVPRGAKEARDEGAGWPGGGDRTGGGAGM